MFWFVILLLVVGGCFYFYQKMVAIEQEIRAGQEPIKAPQDSSSELEAETITPPVVSLEVEKMASKAEPVISETLSLEDEIFEAVQNLPGIKQTEVYVSFADINRKRLQQTLKRMDDEGKIKREKKGSSYLLFPA